MYICRNIKKMNAHLRNITRRIKRFYRSTIVKEQYPMLTPLSRKELRRTDALGIVFMLHHICKKDKNRIPTNEDLKVSPEFLEKIILEYKSSGLQFISLDSLSLMISQKQYPEQPFVAFTIDDGYLDNYTLAYPIFKRNNVPFSIFIATDFIDRKAILWWDTIEELILQNDSITTSDGITYPCKTFQQRWDTFRLLREKILCFNQDNLLEQLKQLFNDDSIDWYEPVKKQAMTWEQISTISKDPLCTIGGHTVSHPALNQVSENRFNDEINGCITKLQSMIHRDIHHFAFPYGSSNEIGNREIDLISNYHFKTVFMANGGCITKNNIQHNNQLPRVYLHE